MAVQVGASAGAQKALKQDCAGELLVTAGDGPPGVNAGLYHSRDAGRHWDAVVDKVMGGNAAQVFHLDCGEHG